MYDRSHLLTLVAALSHLHSLTILDNFSFGPKMSFYFFDYSSSKKNSTPLGGGECLFHTHNFSHLVHTYALRQLASFIVFDVGGGLYTFAVGRNAFILWAVDCLSDGSCAMYYYYYSYYFRSERQQKYTLICSQRHVKTSIVSEPRPPGENQSRTPKLAPPIPSAVAEMPMRLWQSLWRAGEFGLNFFRT